MDLRRGSFSDPSASLRPTIITTVCIYYSLYLLVGTLVTKILLMHLNDNRFK